MACENLNEALQQKAKELSAKFSNSMEEISNDLKNRAKDLDPNIDTSGVDVWVGLDFDVKWENVEIILHLPEVTIKDQTIFLDLPQVTMKQQELIFHTPSVRMETQKVGEYPEFYCDTSTVIPKCTVKMSPIYIDVPVPFMQEQKIILDLPEFKIDTTSFVMGVPEFKMTEQHIIMGLPQFTLKNIHVEAEKAKARGEALRDEGRLRVERAGAAFREQNKVELGVDVAGLFDCYRTELIKSRDVVIAQMDGMITGNQAAINTLVAQKADDNDPTLAALRNTVATMRSKKEKLLEDFVAKLADLDVAQKNAIDGLINISPV